MSCWHSLPPWSNTDTFQLLWNWEESRENDQEAPGVSFLWIYTTERDNCVSGKHWVLHPFIHGTIHLLNELLFVSRVLGLRDIMVTKKDMGSAFKKPRSQRGRQLSKQLECDACYDRQLQSSWRPNCSQERVVVQNYVANVPLTGCALWVQLRGGELEGCALPLHKMAEITKQGSIIPCDNYFHPGQYYSIPDFWKICH